MDSLPIADVGEALYTFPPMAAPSRQLGSAGGVEERLVELEQRMIRMEQAGFKVALGTMDRILEVLRRQPLGMQAVAIAHLIEHPLDRVIELLDWLSGAALVTEVHHAVTYVGDRHFALPVR